MSRLNRVVLEKELAKLRDDTYLIILPRVLLPIWRELYNLRRKVKVIIEYEA
ncbi:MAG: hypothetical protein QXT27_06615 [Pyrobaculum sp.]